MGEPTQEIRAPLLSKEEKQKDDHNLPSASSSKDIASHEDDEENSPVKQVALTVPTTDDPSLPVLTFRMWVLGTVSCVLLSFLNQFFWYRTEPLSITAISAQIAVVPLGQLMASKITAHVFFKGTRWEFTLNPGPFNVKEHVLITIFANSGAGSVYAIHVVTVVKVFYKKNITFLVSLLVVLTTQVLGFGWAGIFRRYLVEPAAMWWPANLVQVSLFSTSYRKHFKEESKNSNNNEPESFASLNLMYNCLFIAVAEYIYDPGWSGYINDQMTTLYRALHEKEERPRRGVTRTQFFIIAFVCSFAYYVFPGYLFQMVTSLSWICWVFPKSVLAQQLGSGLYGLGICAFGIDWSTISSYLGSPLASPWFATANVAAGFIFVMYILTPLSYWLNVFNAKTFPIFSDDLFTSTGHKYNISSIVDSNFHLDITAYDREGRLYLSTFFAMTYGVGFAALSATMIHVALFHGREVWDQTKASFNEKTIDIHTRLMMKYKQVPEWWFVCILLANIVLTIFACEYYNDQLQLPWWGVLLACGIAILFTLPIGIITAITNQTPGLNIITEYIIGYIYPGYPVANMCFKVYGYISMTQAITFLQDFKLGHYMKIPPRTMFLAQVVGTVIACLTYLITAWWLMETIPDICDTTASNSVWTCPSDTVFYDASVIWGLIGPRRIFGDLGYYATVNWFFLGGAVAPILVWLATKAFPQQEWIRLINMPILIGATGNMPPATAINYTTWIVAGFVSGYVVYRYRPDLWQRYNYVLSGSLDSGLAFMGVLIYLCLGLENISVSWWGNDLDGCPLASCPTYRGVVVQGCPIFS